MTQAGRVECRLQCRPQLQDRPGRTIARLTVVFEPGGLEEFEQGSFECGAHLLLPRADRHGPTIGEAVLHWPGGEARSPGY